jgi:putative zinc finger protein
MTCADFDILLCDYVDGILEGDEKAAFETHLAECATCAELARDISTAVAFTGQVPAVEPPDELVTRILFQVPRGRNAKPNAGWLRGLLTGWMEPILQPRFAMGMAMTVLSFSLLAKFAGIPERQLSPEDLHPAKVWASVDDRFHRVVDRAVKYYESMRVVYEVQSRLSEWTEEDQKAEQPEATDGAEGQSGLSPGFPEEVDDSGERSAE